MSVESQMSHQLIRALERVAGPNEHYVYTRIESNLTAQGIPDAVLCIKGKEIWIEYKSSKGQLSSLQIQFASERHLAGNSNCYLIKEIKEDLVFVGRVIEYPLPNGNLTYRQLARFLLNI